MPLPPLTPEQRAAALEKAAAARKARAEVKERLKKNGVSIAEVLNQGETDDMRFKAAPAGDYRIFCGVPGHGISGMHIGFSVKADAKEARLDLTPKKPAGQ